MESKKLITWPEFRESIRICDVCAALVPAALAGKHMARAHRGSAAWFRSLGPRLRAWGRVQRARLRTRVAELRDCVGRAPRVEPAPGGDE